MKTPSFAFYSIHFQRWSLWRQRFLPVPWPNKDTGSAVCLGTQALRDALPMQVKQAVCIASPPSPPPVFCGTDLVQKATVKMAKGMASKAAKLWRLSLPRKFVVAMLPEVYYFSHILDFHLWEFHSQPQKSCQQHSKLAELKKKGQKCLITIQIASTGQNLGFSIISRIGSQYRF